MKDRIIEMLERGERVELECVDRDGFEALYAINKYVLQLSEIIIAEYDDTMGGFDLDVDSCELNNLNLHRSNAFICDSELEYFKIKEPTYTFNDLIDVVVQAYKDGVIPSLELSSEMGVRSVRCLASAILDEWDDYSSGVNNIKSLYTETFVIESEEDVLNIKDEAEMLFLNGEKGVFADSTGDGHYGFVLISNVIHKLPLALLKGATVTQKRGNQCNK